jgi:hypothetical protein
MVVAAPIPSARVTTAASAVPGSRRKERAASRRAGPGRGADPARKRFQRVFQLALNRPTSIQIATTSLDNQHCHGRKEFFEGFDPTHDNDAHRRRSSWTAAGYALGSAATSGTHRFHPRSAVPSSLSRSARKKQDSLLLPSKQIARMDGAPQHSP